MPRRPSPFIEPLHPHEQEKPPTGNDWVQEIKWDGYRVQVHLGDGKATTFIRRGNDWTRQFRPRRCHQPRLWEVADMVKVQEDWETEWVRGSVTGDTWESPR
jgi:ATP-dependent DNA ligase